MGSKSFYRGEEEYCQNNPCREDVLFVEVLVSRVKIRDFAGETGAWWLKASKVRKEKGEIDERRRERNKRGRCGSEKRWRTSRRGWRGGG